MKKKFTQIWYVLDDGITTVVGIRERDESLAVMQVTYYIKGDYYSVGLDVWYRETLPTSGVELHEKMREFDNVDWSIGGDRDSIYADLTDDMREDFKVLERICTNFPQEKIDSPICDITKWVYAESEKKCDIFQKIADLNTEINDYINEVESEIKDAVNKRNEILEMKHIRLYDFLESRRHMVMQMFPETSLEVATGIDGLTVWFKKKRTRIAFGGYNYTILNDKYKTTVDADDAPYKAKQYNKVLTSWDAIQENIFDQNLYEALSEEMTKQVTKAKDRLVKARAELAEVQ